jgi:hypothetical protein
MKRLFLSLSLLIVLMAGAAWAQVAEHAHPDLVRKVDIWKGVALLLSGNVIVLLGATAVVVRDRHRLGEASDGVEANTAAIVQLRVAQGRVEAKLDLVLNHFGLGEDVKE